MNRVEALTLIFLVLIALAAVVWALSGCITIEHMQVGPPRWPGESATTQPETLVEIL